MHKKLNKSETEKYKQEYKALELVTLNSLFKKS